MVDETADDLFVDRGFCIHVESFSGSIKEIARILNLQGCERIGAIYPGRSPTTSKRVIPLTS